MNFNNIFFIGSCLLLLGSATLFSSTSSGVEAVSVRFTNGSVLELDADLFTGDYVNMQQTGLAPDKHDWAIALIKPSTFAGRCATDMYMAQGATCHEMTFNNAPTTSPNSDGTGVQFVLTGKDGLQRDWQATVNVICDPSRDKLYSPNYEYAASKPANVILVDFILTSKGACLQRSGPAPSGGDDGGKKSGISWGGVFMILFWVPLGLYFFGFLAWNYRNGNRGMDLLPHPAFWKSLPILAKDGVTFLVSKARGTAWTPSDLPEGGSSSGSVGGTESAAGGASGGYAAV